jgi:hypothetical protein
MKKKIKLSILSALMCLGISSVAQAAEPANNLKNLDGSNVVERFKEELKVKYPNAVIQKVTAEEAEKIKKELREKTKTEKKQDSQKQSLVSTMGSAPPVTDLYILGIIWDGGNSWQEINGSTYYAPAIKGLSQVVTFEEGYGSDSQWLGTEQITYSNPDYIWEEEAVDYEGDRIVDGWIHYVTFDADTKIPSGQSKQYRFESTSYNAPWNTEKTWLNIPHQ